MSTNSRIHRWELVGLGLICLLAAVARGWNLRNGFFHPDEPLVIEVVQGMRERGDWDTNWVHANLPENLHYDQFNFSGYLMTARVFAPLAELVAGPFARQEDRGLLWYRGLSAVLGTLAVGLTWLLARTLAGSVAAALAGTATALAPLLVQDAHYGRPEAFATVLFLAVAYLCVYRERPAWWQMIAAGLLVGVLAMTKVTLVLAAVFPAWAWWRGRISGPDADTRNWRWVGAGTLCAALAGAWLAAPQAWREPRAFLHGVQALQLQYATGHPPHSLPDGSMIWRLQADYFGQTLGLATATLAALGLAVAAVRRRWTLLVVVFLPLLATAVYFSCQRVFFERNLSHVVPLYFIGAGAGWAVAHAWLRNRGMSRRWGAALTLVVLGAVLWPMARITHAFVVRDLGGATEQRRVDFEQAIRIRHPEITGTCQTALLAAHMIDGVETERRKNVGPLLLIVDDYHDAYTKNYLSEMYRRYNLVALGRLESVYGPLPVCTLLTYHNRSLEYLLVLGRR
jgi:4-amino-4-deoxy-L-arabinose transferase-like glycosyltransferase